MPSKKKRYVKLIRATTTKGGAVGIEHEVDGVKLFYPCINDQHAQELFDTPANLPVEGFMGMRHYIVDGQVLIDKKTGKPKYSKPQ